jgi:7 transmembrane sweet-taste receptor of 3 GCPR
VDPLIYTREVELGTDGWSRVLSTYGVCRSDNVERYLIPISCLNLGVLVMANWQAFEARHIEAEFSESRYIGMVCQSMLQAAITGVPVLFVVKDNPPAFYLVLVFMIFITGMVMMLVIFVPKILFARFFMSKTELEQKDFISFIIQQSSKASSAGRSARSIMSRRAGAGVPAGSGNPSTYQPNSPYASVAPNGHQSHLGTSQFGASQFVPFQFEPVSFAEEQGIREAEVSAKTPGGVVGSQIQTDRMSHMSCITEGSEPFGPPANSVSDALNVTGHTFSTPVSADMQSFTQRNAQPSSPASGNSHSLRRITRPRLTNGISLRGLTSRGSSHHSVPGSPPFVPPSGTHHSPMPLDSDDGEDGMLVFRTMTIGSDGSIHTGHSHVVYDGSMHTGSMHTSHSRLVYSNGSARNAHSSFRSHDNFDDDAATFYDSSPYTSSRTITLSQSDRTLISRESGSLRDVGASFRNAPNLEISRAINENPKPTHSKPRRASSLPHSTRERSSVASLKAIKERKYEDYEDSDSSERSLELILGANRSLSSHARLSVSLSELNCIPEKLGASGSSDSGSESGHSVDEESEKKTDNQNEIDAIASAESLPGDKVMSKPCDTVKIEACPGQDDSFSSFASKSSDDDVEKAR